jgi:hypothetical protein
MRKWISGSLFLIFLAATAASAEITTSTCADGKILVVGDSHLQGGLGVALLGSGGLGNLDCVREYGVVSSMAEDWLQNPMCPSPVPNACSERLIIGYSEPGATAETVVNMEPLPANYGGLKNLMTGVEKPGLKTVVVQLGTNDVEIEGCDTNASSVSYLQQLLSQVKTAGYTCVYVSTLDYAANNEVVTSCGGAANYTGWVNAVESMAAGLGCTVIDSRQVNIGAECTLGGVHCPQAQYNLWGQYIASHMPH